MYRNGKLFAASSAAACLPVAGRIWQRPRASLSETAAGLQDDSARISALMKSALTLDCGLKYAKSVYYSMR